MSTGGRHEGTEARRHEGRSFGFSRELRLRKQREFQRVYEGKVRRHAGPLVVWARPNGLEHSRLGLAVGRRAGSAVVRNRIKRMLRESFRLLRHELPAGYDVVIGVRRHESLPLEEYQRLLVSAARWLDEKWAGKRGSDEATERRRDDGGR